MLKNLLGDTLTQFGGTESPVPALSFTKTLITAGLES